MWGLPHEQAPPPLNCFAIRKNCSPFRFTQFPYHNFQPNDFQHATTSGESEQHGGLLTLGQAREATAAFRSALSLLNDATTSPAGCDTPAAKEEEDTFSSKRSGASPWGSKLYKSRIAIPHLQQGEGLPLFAYKYGILIVKATVQQVLCDETKSRYSSVVLFNWALVFHSEAMLRNPQSLATASTVYTSCLQAIKIAISSRPDHEASSDSAVLAILVLNNLAHIHYEQCAYTDASSCLARVSEILDATFEHHSDCSRTLLSLNDVEEIY